MSISQVNSDDRARTNRTQKAKTLPVVREKILKSVESAKGERNIRRMLRKALD
jgi:hypothetical protein